MVTDEQNTLNASAPRFWLYSFWVILILAFINRLATSVTGYTSTFDTGTPGLMAVNILQGERPLFFYGQHYMGALESYLAAILFWIFGISDTVKSCSPILFSLGWIAASYALFTECLNRKAGFAAALVLAFPGWQILWYNIGTYGGYPGAFFFGTMVLWLAVRVLKREVQGRELFVYIPWIGLLAGLGLWTNYICGAFLGLAFILLVIHKVRVVGFRKDNLPYILAGLPFLLAISPLIDVMLHASGGGSVAKFNFRMNLIQERIGLMTSNLLPELLYWPFRFSDAVKQALAAMLVPALAVTGVAFWKPEPGLSRKWMLIPVYFVGIYLLLYLPHSMASIRASRYLIPGYSVFLCIIFSYGLCARTSGWRFLATMMLIYWTAYNAFCSVHMMDLRRDRTIERQASRQQVIETCNRIGATTVDMVGGYVFGHMGQTYSYLSKGQIQFGSIFDERHPATSQQLETQNPQTILCERGNENYVERSLNGLDVSFSRERMTATTLLYDLQVSPKSNRLIPGTELTVSQLQGGENVTELVTDRQDSTVAEGSYGNDRGLLIDLGSVRTINQFWLTAPGPKQPGLPKKLVIQVSDDGETFSEMMPSHHRVPQSYTKGTSVYFLGYHSLMEYRLPNTSCRYLKLIFRQGTHPKVPSQISELFIFEATPAPSGTLTDDIADMERLLAEGSLDFLAGDRWISGTLFTTPACRGHVFPRYNPKFRSTWYSHYLTPRKGNGLAVSRSLADETESLLTTRVGPNSIAQRIDLNYYTVFLLNEAEQALPDVESRLYFTGHAWISKDYDPVQQEDFIIW